MPNPEQKSARIDWPDTAKTYGIFLVFYGHFAQEVMSAFALHLPLEESLAFSQVRFIYSFHMVLFFIIAGFFAKEKPPSIGAFLKDKATSRLIPVIFFELATFPFHLLLTKDFSGWVSQKWMSIISGFPIFNFITWFLVCLFVIEFIHFLVSRFLTHFKHIVLSIVTFFAAGWYLTTYIDFLPDPVFSDILFIREGIFLYSFYQIGFLAGRAKLVRKKTAVLPDIIGLVVSIGILFFTYDQNKGPWQTFPFYPSGPLPVVFINISHHGDPFFFTVTALAGSLFIFFLARLTPVHKSVLFLGRNTLILMGLNGFFFWFINENLAGWLNMPNEAVSVLLWQINPSAF